MWNDFQTDTLGGMIAENILMEGHDGKQIHAYYSRPTVEGNYPGIVLIPHMPGWDEWCRETARRFTEHGYEVVCPNIYEDFGHGTPAEISGKAREAGGVHDDSVMGDVKNALGFLRSQPNTNGKVGVIGMCSGGRHAFLAACQMDFDACADCWGGGVIQEETSEARPVSPIEYVENLNCPIIGIFGKEDRNPDTAQVDATEAALINYKKEFEFSRYYGAGHGIWYYHTPMYRQEQAMESWEKVFAFFEKHLRT